tara:strand:+ start:7581 stop:8210 length:630 start_codon:yes stop_codon:yes gene_type:complete
LELQGKYSLKADREQVWTALNDPTILQQCIPGCETLTKASDTNFSASVVAKVGPVKAKFTGEVELTELSPPSSYKISGEGKGGAAGFASGSADVKLEESDEGGTILSYSVNAQVGGKLAQIGSRLIDSTAKKLSREFFDKFTELVDGGADPSLNASDDLENLADQEKGDLMENDNKTEENVYPNTHWTLWVLGLISVGALVAFALNLKF